MPPEVIERYREEQAELVKDDLKETKGPKIIRGNFMSSAVYKKSASDVLQRSLVRHDSDKLAKVIMSLL